MKPDVIHCRTVDCCCCGVVAVVSADDADDIAAAGAAAASAVWVLVRFAPNVPLSRVLFCG